MRKRIFALFIVMLFVLPTTLGFVTIPDGSNLQNVTELVKDPVLSYEEERIKHLASGGSVDSDLYIDGDYWDTWVDDTSYLNAYPINYTGIHLDFNITERLPITEIYFFLRWQVNITGPADEAKTVYWMIYNFDTLSYETVYSVIISNVDMPWEDREESITVDESYINSTNHVRFYAYGNIYIESIEVDYAYLTVTKGYAGEFRETLPDDLLFYPDAFPDGTIELADYGEISDESSSEDYVNTHVLDGTDFSETGAYDIEIWFEIDTTDGFESFSYAHYLYADSQTDCDLAAYNFDMDAYVKIDEPLPASYDWMNGTINDPDFWNTTHVAFQIHELAGTADFYWDYAQVTVTRLTLADSGHYAESFSDISDCTDLSSDGLSTDGDVISAKLGGTGWGWQAAFYTNTPSFNAGDWITTEIRVDRNASVENLRLYLYGHSLDDATGDNYLLGVADGIYLSDSWVTYKASMLLLYDLESVRYLFRVNDEYTFYSDYIRISSNTDEMGWQHDGSTTGGITAYTDATASSDGDELLITGTGTGDGSIWLSTDPTSTISYIEEDYYQFLEILVTSVYNDIPADNKAGQFRIFGSSNDYVGGWFVEAGLYRFNIPSGTSGDLRAIKFQVDNNDNYTVDYAKVYSIANYTVTQSSTTTDDILHVDIGVLNSTMDDGEFILEYDPPFNFTGSYTWTKTTTSGESYLSFLRGGWTSYTNETTGPLYAGTTTGLRIKLNESANIQTIEFSVRQAQWVLIGTAIMHFDMPNWWLIATAVITFFLPLGTLTLEFLLMIMGAVMIPFSTLFLVYGGRREMDRDKIFFFLLMFLLGWGFFLGGL